VLWRKAVVEPVLRTAQVRRSVLIMARLRSCRAEEKQADDCEQHHYGRKESRTRPSTSLASRPSGQIVYHANFLRFMERGRTNYLRLLGTNQHALLQEARNDALGFTFVVCSMTVDFLKPAVLDDVLDVVTLPQEVRGASAGMQARRRSPGHGACTRGVYLRWKSAAHPEGTAACDGRA
jgi:YbgC/YbaW family acyl-CoA thioester hydrolase